MARGWCWLPTAFPSLPLHASLMRAVGGSLLALPPWSHSRRPPALFEACPCLPIQPLDRESLTLITPRLTGLGRLLEIPDAKVWRRLGSSEPGQAQPGRFSNRDRQPATRSYGEHTLPCLGDNFSARLSGFKLVHLDGVS